MNKQDIDETIINCIRKIWVLRAEIDQTRAAGSDLAEDSRLQLIAELQYAIELFQADRAAIEAEEDQFVSSRFKAWA